MDLLQKLKYKRGVIKTDSKLDTYYQSMLDAAKAELKAEDISESVLTTEYGQNCIVHCADLMIDKTDRATNPTMILMKNTLSAQTKGERCSDD